MSLKFNLKVRNKLIIAIGLPLLLLIYISSINILTEIEKFESVESVKELVQINELLSNLIVSLQDERGLSNFYIINTESHDPTLLFLTRNVVDDAYKQYQFFINNISINSDLLVFTKSLNLLSSRINQISSIRHDFDNEVNGQEYFDYYSSLIELALQLIDNITTLSTSLDISKLSASFTKTQYLAEYFAKGRGVIHHAIHLKKISDEDISKVKLLHENYKQMSLSLVTISDEDTIKKINTLEKSDLNDEIIFLRVMLLDHKNFNNVNSLDYDWWIATSDYLNELHNISQDLSQKIISTATLNSKHAKNQTVILALVSILIIFLVVLLGFSIIHGLSKNIRNIEEFLRKHETTNKKESIKPLDIDTNDEIGHMAKVFNQYIEKQNNDEKKVMKSLLIEQQLNKDKESFLRNISHELRTPLNGVLGMGDILESTNLDEEQTEYLNALVSSGKDLLELVDAILMFSNFQNLPSDDSMLEFNLYDLLSSSVFQHQEKLKNKQVRLSLHESNKALIVTSNPVLVQRVSNFLLDNAIKFTHEGTITVSLEIDDSKIVSIIFTDTGVGIDNDDLELIFDLFVQADSSTTRLYGGIGLGLAMARKMARSLGGDVSVKSELGKGSSFIFTFKTQN